MQSALVGRHVHLEPLSERHIDGIAAAAAMGDRETFGYAPVPGAHSGVLGAMDAATAVATNLKRAATGMWIPFAQVRAHDDTVVGMTNYLNVERWNGADQAPCSVEIGGTWLSPVAQRSAINTEAKLLLLANAFETWNVVRVQIKTDERNERSRAAITRLGATFEGILRNYQPGAGDIGHGAPRNTAMYSITDNEWPAVKQRLQDLLSTAR
jgi:N-acetyltransferase